MGSGDCLVKLPGQIKGLFQREPEVVLLSSGMREEKVGYLGLPRELVLHEGDLTCYGSKGVAMQGGEWGKVAQEQGAHDLVVAEIPEPG